ncbi:MAG: ubiquinol-cytochrome c reductase iron-sulfur subunit [Firmicutes bacterium]|nr:ubiquinol-cytochrome c reductase iron-sulfur subunit [Alicyclobacillaceae bacterium]MCL6496475.1 ubiquinol-cytochrome c reductase iron-sulfur subunit [Bacillota bacterium]
MAGKQPQKAGWTRRDFFNWVLNVTMGVIALLVAVPAVGAAITPAFARSKPIWIRLGLASKLQAASLAAGTGGVGSVVKASYTYTALDHWVKQPASDYAYLRYIGGSCPFYILSPICTHLGCHVDWVPSANQFHCPCHGSVYTIDGLNVSGPAPRPLGVFRWKLTNGEVWIAREDTFTGAWERQGESPRRPCLMVKQA